MYRTTIISAAFVGMLLFVLHLLATVFYWYSTIFGFDKGMHFLGGIFLALLSGAYVSRSTSLIPVKHMLITMLLFVFIVGLLWEYYEYIVQYLIKAVHLAGVRDSIGDLIFDMTGGMIGSYFVIRFNTRYNSRQ